VLAGFEAKWPDLKMEVAGLDRAAISNLFFYWS
jgi:hypothetical protein